MTSITCKAQMTGTKPTVLLGRTHHIGKIVFSDVKRHRLWNDHLCVVAYHYGIQEHLSRIRLMKNLPHYYVLTFHKTLVKVRWTIWKIKTIAWIKFDLVLFFEYDTVYYTPFINNKFEQMGILFKKQLVVSAAALIFCGYSINSH